MVDFLHFLKNTSYPGRGILVGKDRVYYFIMGRSENSRNRVFVKTEDGIRTEAHDPAKLSCAGGVRQYLHGKHEKRCGRGPAAGDHGNHAGRHPDRKASGPPL